MTRRKAFSTAQVEAIADGAAGFRDRVIELRRVKAAELLPSPKNWRRHPEAQRAALRGILSEVGYAGALLARETPEGLQLIDGHLRAETTPTQRVPVLVLDVTEAEADKLLATIDPLSAMAETDEEALAALLGHVTSDDDGLRAMFSDMRGGPLDFGDPPESVQENLAELEEIKAQRRSANVETVTKHDTEKYLIVVFPTRQDREKVVESLGLPTDERYIVSSAIRISPAGIAKPSGKSAASAKKSGACG